MDQEKIKLLVVDDEVDLCNLVSLRLKQEGYEVLTATSGNEALKVIQREAIDLVISDIRMPDGDGAYLLDRVKEIDHSKPAFLFVSGYSDYELNEVLDRGAEDLLKKPLDFNNLVQIVQERLVSVNRQFNKKVDQSPVKSFQRSFAEFDASIKEKKWNLGSGGIFLALDSDFPRIQDLVNFEIVFEDGKYGPIKGSAVCRWTRLDGDTDFPSGVGLEFVDLERDSAETVNKLVGERKIKAYIPRG